MPWSGSCGNLFTTLMTCLLAWALLFPKGLLPQDYELAVVQSRFFEVSWGPIGRVLFLIVAAAFLTDTWLATADGVSRMQADIVTTLFPAASAAQSDALVLDLLRVLTAVTCTHHAPAGAGPADPALGGDRLRGDGDLPGGALPPQLPPAGPSWSRLGPAGPGRGGAAGGELRGVPGAGGDVPAGGV